MISDCIAAAGISTIVWIDDFFANASRDDLAAAVLVHLKLFKDAGETMLEGTPFAQIDLTRSNDEIEEAADEVITDLNDIELAEAERQLAERGGGSLSQTAIGPDLTDEEFAELQNAFGPGLRTFSLGQWTSRGMTEFAAAAEETLFLIDKEFSRERAGMSGDDVLRDLVTRTRAFCIMLTHTCTEGEQEQRRVDIARAEELDAYRFSVVSKQQGGQAADIDSRFSRAIYAVMTHRYTGEIAHAVSETIQTSAESTVSELVKQSVFDLDQAVFENSNREGVPEFDVVLRIFRIQQRQAMSDMLRDATLQSRLRAARRFRQSTTNLRKHWPKPVAEMSTFREWRRNEVLEDGAALNQLHAPLACGDVFESQTQPPRRYIFLAQPCDVMVREDGSRRNSVGLLVQVAEADLSSAKSSDAGGRYYDIKGVFGADKMWRADFQKITVVNTTVLDLAVFNPDGSVHLVRDHAAPSIALPPGWQIKFEKLKRKVFSPANRVDPLPVGMGANVQALAPTTDANTLRYPLQRSGRLEMTTATAILAAWASFQTRAALEHDFAKPAPTTAEIERRAYFISEERRQSGAPADPVADWCQAEDELNS